jgi:hypothetical protein
MAKDTTRARIDHKEGATQQTDGGASKCKSCQLKEIEVMVMQRLAADEKALTEVLEDTLADMHKLKSTYDQQGRKHDAQRLDQQVKELREKLSTNDQSSSQIGIGRGVTS